jgi:hypothetical protein
VKRMHYTYLLVRGCLVSGDVGVVKGLCVVCWGVVGERFEIILAVGKVEMVPALASKRCKRQATPLVTKISRHH